MLAVTDEVVVDEQVKESVTSSIQKVSLWHISSWQSGITHKGRLKEAFGQPKKTDVLSISVEESTHCTDMAQLCFDVWRSFREELLGLILMEGPTTGEPMFLKIITFLTSVKWIYRKLVFMSLIELQPWLVDSKG